MDISLHLGFNSFLTHSACSLKLIRPYMQCLTSPRYHIRRETPASIFEKRTAVGLCIFLGKSMAHENSTGTDLADALANKVADGRILGTPCSIGAEINIGDWTLRCYTHIPQPRGAHGIYHLNLHFNPMPANSCINSDATSNGG
jgi:hypothetical protein